jgi:limonene-1,2-epoxide hydrolase
MTALGAAAAIASAPSAALAEHHEGGAMSNNERIIRAFIAAWSNLDPAELVTYFTADGIYHNMMLEPVSGHENLQAFIGGFVGNWSETEWEVINIVADGDIVMAERMDRTRIGDKRVDLPCTGVFEMRGGKIAVWRDYFDLATYTGAFAE